MVEPFSWAKERADNFIETLRVYKRLPHSKRRKNPSDRNAWNPEYQVIFAQPAQGSATGLSAIIMVATLPRMLSRQASVCVPVSPKVTFPVRQFATRRRGFLHKPAFTSLEVPPESPKYINVPKLLQAEEIRQPAVKGILPVPRNLFDKRVPIVRFETPTASNDGEFSSYSQMLGDESFRTVGVSLDARF